ncbi:MAG: DUF1015 domain-containing protein [Treponema sp.]|jgi:hypothetical protein|nr:DUF1015 domain-containing protein [Treponema sp.]
MNNCRQKLNSLGVEVPEILLPRNVGMKWPVIACDQFTQDRDYWERTKAAVSGSPSTLDLIFPEVFLSDADSADRIKNIHSTMSRFLKDEVFEKPRKGFIYLERDTPFHKKRRGLIAAIDLEKYEWKTGSRPLIRCTEGTVSDRLPPRMDIRRGAPLELPHVLLLIDDDTDSLLPAVAEMAKKNAHFYNTQLVMESGSVTGWFLDGAEDEKASAALSFITEKLEELCRRSAGRYEGGQPFLFAVGDGNHSLAAAKGIWEEYKTIHKNDYSHPCRYALVEIENIYDPAIQFEPIHRLVFNAGFDEIVSILSALPDFSCSHVDSSKELAMLCGNPSTANCFGVISEGRYALLETSASGIATACLQPLLDNALLNGKPLSIDYIHDKEELFRLSAINGTSGQTTGILLPPVQKSGLFETVGRLGPLPRKSFSMGHSCEKRFYLECRKLF